MARLTSAGAPRKELSLFDSTSIIVGIIVGAGIFESSPLVAESMGSAVGTLAIWLVGGLIALSGALCYAELASTYPAEGGDYVYLSRAYGPLTGYLFGWSQLAIVRPGDIALMAFVFGRYFEQIAGPFPGSRALYAASAVAVLTAINVAGVKSGKWTQNVLTVAKVGGALAVAAIGLLAPAEQVRTMPAELDLGGLKLALILVLFTYGGWNEMAYVAGEVRDPDRNISRALACGTLAVAIVYIVINAAFLRALGYDGMCRSEAVAVDTVSRLFPEWAARFVAVLICLSALGAVNGLTFTGARISYALGSEHPVFGFLGHWSSRLGTPARALLVQGMLSLGIILFAGSFVSAILYTAPVVWAFFLTTGISLFVLRKREAGQRRPYRVSGYPMVPAVFVASCGFMLYASITYAMRERVLALVVLAGIMVLGLLLFNVGRKSRWVPERGPRVRRRSLPNSRQ